jgi:hypothetical protein
MLNKFANIFDNFFKLQTFFIEFLLVLQVRELKFNVAFSLYQKCYRLNGVDQQLKLIMVKIQIGSVNGL